MKYLPFRELRNNPGKAWKLLESEPEIVITNNGKPTCILSGVNEDTLEDTLRSIRRAKAQSALAGLRRQAEISGVSRMTAEDIEKEIADARKSRRK